MNDGTLYEKLIYEDQEKGFQFKLVVSEFRGVQYIHLRKYFLDYEGNYIPTKEGATFPANIESIFALLDGIIELCSVEESTSVINKYFKDKLDELASKQSRSVPE